MGDTIIGGRIYMAMIIVIFIRNILHCDGNINLLNLQVILSGKIVKVLQHVVSYNLLIAFHCCLTQYF